MRKSLLIFLVAIFATSVAFADNIDKLSAGTQMFLSERRGEIKLPRLKDKMTVADLQQAAGDSLILFKDEQLMKKRVDRKIAEAEMVNGVEMISAFVKVKSGGFSAIEAMGAVMQTKFNDNLAAMMLPADKIEKIADLDNVIGIEVAEVLQPLNDLQRSVTQAGDAISNSAAARALGLTKQYTGKNVILGVIDTGIDFTHIAFKDKNGNTRIKRAYKLSGSNSTSLTTYSSASQIASLTYDTNAEDHGTHTSTTAGGSSVIVNGSTVTVTDDHANATYGGMAPEADLVLAGLSSLYTTSIGTAIQNICNYADEVGKPCVISLSLGSQVGPHDGTGTIASIVNQYAGNNHIIVYAASNDGMRANAFVEMGTSNGGGMYASGTSTKAKPMMANLQKSWSNATGNVQLYSPSIFACARTANVPTALKIHVVNTSNGNVVYSSDEYTSSGSISVSSYASSSGLASYFSGSGSISVSRSTINNKYCWTISGPTIQSTNYSQNSSNIYESTYALCISIYPTNTNTSTIIDMWENSQVNWFGTDLTLSSTYANNYNLVQGNDECSVSDNATYNKVISVGAYVTKNSITDYNGTSHDYSSEYPNIGDHASFSSWQTAGYGPLGTALPHINAPGARIVAGVNHYHTKSVDDYSYWSDDYIADLVVNNSNYPYAAMEGTSMATPCASGIIAQWLQACVEAGKTPTPDYIKEVMAATWDTDQWTNGAGHGAKTFGTHGKINAIKGIQYILGATSGPTITATPTSIDFGNVTAGTTTTQTFTVTGENLEGNISLSKSGNNYTIDKTSISKNSDGSASATVTVTFAPTANVSQTYTGTVTLTSSNASSVTVSLTGKGVYTAPAITANPTSLSFTGNSGTTYTKTVTVTGTNLQGNITAAISGDANGFYSVSPTTINNSNGSASSTVTVTWAPTAGGTSTANLVLTTTGTGASSVTVPITGTAQGPTITANPPSVTFTGAYATRTYTQAVTVTGTNLTQNITAAISGANVYSIDNTSLTTTGGTITVTYAPAVAGTTNATLTLSSTGASSVTVPITGTAQAATPTLVVDKSSLTYDTQLSESSSQTITVGGRFLSENVTVTLTDVNNVFSVDKSSLDYATLNNDATLTVTVTFNSANEGTFIGTLNLTSGSTSQQVALTGTANDTPSYIYVLTTTLTAGNEYLIVSGNSAGSAYAMGHSNTTVATNAVTIKSDASVADAPYIESDDVDATSVWTAGTSGSLWTFKNGSYYATVSGSGGNRSLTFATSSSYNWTQGTNQLYYKGQRNSYYLRYYNNSFSINSSANNIYLYEKTQVVKTPSLTVDPTQLSFSAKPGETLTQSFTVTGARLSSDVTVTMTNDVGGVFTVDKSNISISEATNGATVTVTFNAPQEMGSYRVGQITLTSGSATANVYIFASVGENGTAYGNYLDIKKYSTIGLNDCYAEEFNAPYSYTEYESDECAWLVVPGAMPYIGSAYMDQKWLGRYNANGYWYGHTWDATDVFQGSSYFATTIDESATGTWMLGPNVDSDALTTNTSQFYGFYNVTNCTQAKAYGYNNSSVSSTYAAFLAVYELTENADGTMTLGSQVDWQSSTTTSSTVTMTSAELDASKIYRVYVGGYRNFFYEVAFKTPLVTSEATLAEIERSGYTGNRYTISDELVAVYAAADKGYLWCKDQGDASIDATEIKDGQIDYMKERATENEYWQRKGDWDQSNWVLLKFPEPTQTNGIQSLLENAVGKTIASGSLTGRYINDLNYTIEVLPVDNVYTLSTGSDAGYVKNLYCTANFLESNLNLTDDSKGAEGVRQGQTAYYFFMNPKVQEVCEITYAEWDGNNTFVVPDNDSQISGAITVDWSYNAEGTQTPAVGTPYRFVAVVNRTEGSTYGHLKDINRDASSNFVIYPLNFTAGNGNVITAINRIDGSRDVVDVYYVNSTGLMSKTPFQGVNIIVTRYSDGSRTTVKKVFK